MLWIINTKHNLFILVMIILYPSFTFSLFAMFAVLFHILVGYFYQCSIYDFAHSFYLFLTLFNLLISAKRSFYLRENMTVILLRYREFSGVIWRARPKLTKKKLKNHQSHLYIGNVVICLGMRTEDRFIRFPVCE